jgi:hypothetical protein
MLGTYHEYWALGRDLVGVFVEGGGQTGFERRAEKKRHSPVLNVGGASLKISIDLIRKKL